MKFLAFLLVVAVAVAVAVIHAEAHRSHRRAAKYARSAPNSDWNNFKQTHGKTYASASVEAARLAAFAQAKNRIDQHNHEFSQGNVHFSMGVNRYADVPHAEFNRTMNGYRRPNAAAQQPTVSGVLQSPAINLQALPASVNWKTLGFVTPVKDQGQCGSCWAFSATGALEGQTYRKTGKLVSLSEQNLVDCAYGATYSSYGCNGGWMDGAFYYIKVNKGIDTGAYYPYKAVRGTCRYSASFIGATDTGFIDLQSGSETVLQNAVASIGPIAIAIDASRPSFQLYKSGVYYDAGCSSTRLNHGVLLVGYGTDPVGGPYWLVKNSWGTSWGESGYIRIARNRNNHCGVATAASSPTV